MKRIICLLLFFLCSGMSVFAAKNETVDSYYEMARDYYDMGDFTNALNYANQVIKINPEHFGANNLIIKLTPANKRLTGTTLDTKVLPKPQNNITQNIISDKLNEDGEKYYAEHNYDKAKTFFLNSIKAYSQNRYALNNLGLVYLQKKDYKNAEKYFKKSNEMNSYFTVPLDNLGWCFIEQNQPQRATEYLKLAILKNKNDYCAHYLLGLAYKMQSKYVEATRSFNDAIQINPDFALLYLQLADTYYLSKDYNWSNVSIEKYIKLCPTDDYAYYILAKNYKGLKDYNIAKNYIFKAIQLNNCIEYREELADIEDSMGNTTEAINILKNIQSTDGAIYNKIGAYYTKLKDNDNAIEFFKKASASKDARPIYLYNMALIYKQMDDIKNYDSTITALKNIKPLTAQDYIDLSAIYLDNVGKNEALAVLDSGIKISPYNRDLYEAKSKIYTLTNDKTGLQKNINRINKVFKNEKKI